MANIYIINYFYLYLNKKIEKDELLLSGKVKVYDWPKIEAYGIIAGAGLTTLYIASKIWKSSTKK